MSTIALVNQKTVLDWRRDDRCELRPAAIERRERPSWPTVWNGKGDDKETAAHGRSNPLKTLISDEGIQANPTRSQAPPKPQLTRFGRFQDNTNIFILYFVAAPPTRS
jgi:hypothetical protein